jgi:hypothetical protein
MLLLGVIIMIVFGLWLLVGYVGFRVAICRGHELDIENRESLTGTSWDLYYEEICEGISWINSHFAEEIEIQSEDGLKLHGRLIENPNAKGTVLMFHGYRTHPEVDFSASAHVYYESGNHILLIDQRSSGKSEGKYIGFGVLESRDCRAWAQYAAQRFGSDKEIILAGLSMGASTVLMAAEQDLPENVTGIVADSAFSSPKEIIQKKIHQSYHCNGHLFTVAIGVWSRLLAGYSLNEVSVVEIMKNNQIPVFFIHGKADSLVPVEMTIRAAKNCKSASELLLVDDAEHGTGYLVDNETYQKKLWEFCS